jgi:RNA polymerase sigma-70 factor (ECF subfamily)
VRREVPLESVPDGLGPELVRLLPRLRAHARRRVGPEAEDLVQETLLRALERSSTFEPGRAAWPWLRTVADRVASRRWEREARAPEARDVLDVVADGCSEDRLADRDEVETLLGRLSPAEREVVESHYLRGEPVAAIAAGRRSPEGTIKARLHRARRRLFVIAASLSAGAAVAFLPRPGSGDPVAPPSAGVLHDASIRVEHIPVPEPVFPRVDRRRAPLTAPNWTVTGGRFAALVTSSVTLPPEK